MLLRLRYARHHVVERSGAILYETLEPLGESISGAFN
jgi:hypothetical protein